MTQTVADQIKEAGFKSVKEFAALINVTPRTLNNWTAEQIEESILFAKLKREIKSGSEKGRIIVALLN
jgi:DNA-binding transcriptional regulator YiaG